MNLSKSNHIIKLAKQSAKAILPPILTLCYHRFKSSIFPPKHFFEQSLVEIKCGKYYLLVPSSHILVSIQSIQPQRDLFVGITAKYISQKYPQSTIVDIGANVGDTAAIISTYCKNPLVLVEPSDYYYSLLLRNVRCLPNQIKTVKSFIANGDTIAGSLQHWGGTAYFNQNSKIKSTTHSLKLSDVCPQNTSLIKLDTDGFDFSIILNSLSLFQCLKPALLFENQIRNKVDLDNAQKVISSLSSLGYKYYIVWDDPGFLMIASESTSIIDDLNHYQFKVFQAGGRISIYNYDILCLHENDYEVFLSVKNSYRLG